MMTSALILAALLAGDPMASCPLHAKHTATAVDARHDTLGMSHDATHHNFRLFADGGAIELHANNVSDAETVAGIRTHLKKIAAAFSKNDFTTPEFVHGRPPDGVPAMQRLRRAIRYQYEELPDGARVSIETKNREALSAVHDFLRFQVADHRSGDSGKIEAR
jgi:hypothetical protein